MSIYTLAPASNPCYLIGMNKTNMTFDSNGIAASDERLRSIALECLRAERAMLEADRAARAAGAQLGTWSI